MQFVDWNDWYFSGGWFLWLGFLLLLFSSIGNWRYTDRVRRRFGRAPHGAAFELLDVRCPKGEITRDEYALIKSDVSATRPSISWVDDSVAIAKGFGR